MCNPNSGDWKFRTQNKKTPMKTKHQDRTSNTLTKSFPEENFANLGDGFFF